MLSDPNDESPANIDAAVSSTIQIMFEVKLTYLHIIIALGYVAYG